MEKRKSDKGFDEESNEKFNEKIDEEADKESDKESDTESDTEESATKKPEKPKKPRKSDHVYLAISPNPEWGNYTSALAYEDKDGKVSKVPNQQSQPLHFLKVGDEQHFGDRVSKYNTHNPQIWFHYIVFSDYKDKLQKGLGTEIKKRFEGFESSKSCNEWFLIWNAKQELKDLCEFVLKYGVGNKKADKAEQSFDFVTMKESKTWLTCW